MIRLAERVAESYSPPRRRNRYPWPLWMNGERWVLKRGTDFHEVLAASCRQAAVNYAIRHALVAETAVPDDDTVVIQMLGDGSDRHDREHWADYSLRLRREHRQRQYAEMTA